MCEISILGTFAEAVSRKKEGGQAVKLTFSDVKGHRYSLPHIKRCAQSVPAFFAEMNGHGQKGGGHGHCVSGHGVEIRFEFDNPTKFITLNLTSRQI